MHLAVIDLLPDFGPDRPLGDRFRLLDPAFRSADAVLLRSSSPSVIPSVESDTVLREQLSATPTGILLPLTQGAEEAVGVRFLAGFGSPPEDVPLSDIRELEFRLLLRESGAVLLHEGAHFVLPNRTLHADAFIRTSYILNSTVNVARLSDWLAPSLSPRTALVTDDAHLLVLLMKLRLDALRRFQADIPAIALDTYPPDLTIVREHLRQLKAMTPEVDTIVLVESVNSSGHLAGLFAQATTLPLKVVALCHARDDDPPTTVECFARYPIATWPVGAEGKCSQCSQRHTIYVDPATLECKPDCRPEIVRPDMKIVGRHAAFWRWARDADAVRLHAWVEHIEDGQHRSRHHGIYFDMARLARHLPFREVCLAKLRDLSRPDLILIPNHANAPMLQELAAEAFGTTIATQVTAARLTETQKQTIQQSSQVLLLDDAFLTGSTLLSFKHQIYYASQCVGRIAHLDVFVLLARPSDASWERNILLPFYAVDRVPHVKSGHVLYVPEPGPSSCPWCEELTFLKGNRGHVTSDAARTALNARIQLLEGAIDTPPLFAPAERLDQHLLTLGSFFGDLDEVTAFAAASCVAHDLATGIENSRGLFMQPEVDLQLIIEGYYEAVLLAGMLRTFTVKHLRAPSLKPVLGGQIAKRPANLSYPGTVGELAWAAVQGKLPPGPVLALLDRLQRPDNALVMLRELTTQSASSSRVTLLAGDAEHSIQTGTKATG